MAAEITFDYTNYKGETERRTVKPDRLHWLENPGFGYEPGWFLTGVDTDRNAVRSFRIESMRMRPAADGSPVSAHGMLIMAVFR